MTPQRPLLDCRRQGRHQLTRYIEADLSDAAGHVAEWLRRIRRTECLLDPEARTVSGLESCGRKSPTHSLETADRLTLSMTWALAWKRPMTGRWSDVRSSARSYECNLT